MDGFEKLHNDQDEFIKKTLQADKIVSQPIFENFTSYMEKTNIKIKRYSYKQQKIIIFLLFLLLVSVGLNVYLGVVKQTPVTITNISKPAESKEETVIEKQDTNNENIILENTVTEVVENIISADSEENVIKNEVFEDASVVENTASHDSITNTVVEEPKTTEKQESVNTTITPALFTDINTSEVKNFVNQFAIGINKLKLPDTTVLESNTILLYIAQQYFSSKSSLSSSLNVDTTYAASTENFHKFLSELTINDYSTVDYLKSYNNYIGYFSHSKSYVYGKDYSTLSKEKYTCTDVTITNKEDNIYTAEANVTRTYEGEESTYKITFTFKVNSNYKYQKYKLLSLKSRITSGSVDNAIHLVGGN